MGSNLIRLRRVDSTNNYARNLIRDKTAIEGTVVMADEQTDGRGQRSNLWLTEPEKNLTCSYILRPVFLAAKDQFMLSATVALAVFDTVSYFLPNNEVKIKWPNDVLIDGKKVAGILIENTLRGSMIETSIAGIGLNVNQNTFQPELNATSLALVLNDEFELETVLDKLNKHLEKHYLQLREGNFVPISTKFNDCLFGIGQKMTLTLNGKKEDVKILGVNRSGELELERADDSSTHHQHHEIAWNHA